MKKSALLVLGICLATQAQAYEPSREIRHEAQHVRRVYVRKSPAYRLCVVPFTPKLLHAMFAHKTPQDPQAAQWAKAFPDAEKILTKDQSCFLVDARTGHDPHTPQFTEFAFQNHQQKKGGLAQRFVPPPDLKPGDPAKLPYDILADVIAVNHDFLINQELGSNIFQYSQVSSDIYCGVPIDFSKPFLFRMIAQEGQEHTFHWP